MSSYYLKENITKSIFQNGKLLEEVRNKENINGNIKTKKIIYKGILVNGKLRKKPVFKQVSFSPEKEYIKPTEEYNNNKIFSSIEDRILTPFYPYNKTMKKKRNKRNKTMKKKNKDNTSRKIKK